MLVFVLMMYLSLLVLEFLSGLDVLNALSNNFIYYERL